MSLEIESQKDFEQYLLDATQLHQQGHLHQAIDIYRSLLDLAPQASFIHYNLAHALSEIEQHQEALKHYTLAVKNAPDDTDILFNLGCCQKKNGMPEDAAHTYQKLLALNEKDIDARYNLANCYKDLEHHAEAICHYKKVLELVPDHLSSLNNLAFLYHKRGDENDAIVYYQKVIQLNPENSSAHHMLSALKGEVISEAPVDYVQTVFDNYSSNYEASLLDKLEYRVPQKIKAAFLELFPQKNRFNCLLDLGCGSGLGALEFKDFCDRMIGVDLSPRMLDLAEEKKIYDQLYCQEILAFLTAAKRQYDIILAADVFTYIGDLEPVVQQVYDVCLDNCIFMFSTETCKEKYVLRKSGRFAHSERYLQEVLEAAGWKIHTRFTTDLRREKDGWISGMIHFAVK